MVLYLKRTHFAEVPQLNFEGFEITKLNKIAKF